MSLRRSTRVQSQTSMAKSEGQNGGLAAETALAKKRPRKPKASEDAAAEAIAQEHAPVHDAGTRAIIHSTLPPSTPDKKRRKVGDSKVALAPHTPAPAAVTLKADVAQSHANYSSGDIDDIPPPSDAHLARPNLSNAMLVTPGGVRVPPSVGNSEESPSKPSTRPVAPSNVLEDACAHLIRVDPTMKPLIDRFPCHIFSPEGLAEEVDPFRSITSGIMAQQVSGAAASSIKKKFIALFPADACPAGFPPPALVVRTPLSRLREAGLSQRKAEYIQGLAERFEKGVLNMAMLRDGTDEDVKASLVAVRGLGAWSAEMFMCFGLKRMDIFSTGDLGVQRGMAAHAGRDVARLKAKGGGKWKYMSEKDMLDMSEKYAPYRSLFMWYMWRVEDGPTDISAVQDN